MKWSKQPIIFDHNRITRSYIGGKLLNEWRGMDFSEDAHACEELLATSIGAISEGKEEGYAISKTLNGVSLKEILQDEPEEILGSKYHKVNPYQLSVLARAGDTIVRLVMQCHPRREDAKTYFGEASGKTEAWYIARTREDGDSSVYAGFKCNVRAKDWKALIEKQDIDGMLACMHQIPVKMGDVILIPAGMPHAVGPGCIFLELHECSDITIRVERKINNITLSDKEMYNGLSQEEGLRLFDYQTYSEEEIAERCIMREREIFKGNNAKITIAIDEKNTNAFGMNILYIDEQLHLPKYDGHRLLIPVEHDLLIQCESGEYEVKQGWGCLIPASLKEVVLKGKTKEQVKVVMGLPGQLYE